MKRKPVIAMDVVTSGFGGGGGPFTSTTRIMNSDLKHAYDFKKVYYRKELGSGLSIKRIMDLVSQLKEIQPDLVHFTGLQLSGFHMAIACRLAGIKNTVVTVRGFSGDAMYFNLIKKIIVSYILEPITLMLSKKVIGVSRYVVSRNIIQLLASKKSVQIYNFPPDPINVSKKRRNIRNELGLSSSDVVVVSVARITKDKGYHILEEVIINLKTKEDLKFVIVGDGDYLDEMKDKLIDQINKKQVFLLGYRDDVNMILQNSDIFVLPTLHETLSVALLEASQASLALIASNTGGVPEIVENNFNGKLVTTGSVEEFTAAINQVYSDSLLRTTFGMNAKNKIIEKFSSEEIVSKTHTIYSDLMGGNV